MPLNHNAITVACAVFVGAAWLFGIWRLRVRRRRRARAAEVLAAAEGLRMGDDLTMRGHVAGVEVAVAPSSVSVGQAGGDRGRILCTRVDVTIALEAAWSLCVRRDLSDPPPALERELASGDEAFDEHRFWEDAELRAMLLELDPLCIHARPDGIEAHFRKSTLTDGHDEAPLIRRDIHAAL